MDSLRFRSVGVSPLIPPNPESTSVSHSVSIGESAEKRTHSGGSGQPQIHAPGEVNEFVSEVVTEIDRAQIMEFLHVGGKRLVMYSPPIYD